MHLLHGDCIYIQVYTYNYLHKMEPHRTLDSGTSVLLLKGIETQYVSGVEGSFCDKRSLCV